MITVTRTAEDRLSRERWGFVYDTNRNALVLNYYGVEIRPSHDWGYTTAKQWLRNGFFGGINKDDVHLPDEIMAAAKQEFIDTISVVK